MLSLSFCILLLASLFHTMTKVKYKVNIILSNNAYSWCNTQDSNFMRRLKTSEHWSYHSWYTSEKTLQTFYSPRARDEIWDEKGSFTEEIGCNLSLQTPCCFVSPGFGLKHWQRRAGNDSSPREGSGVKLEVVSCKITLQPEASI